MLDGDFALTTGRNIDSDSRDGWRARISIGG